MNVIRQNMEKSYDFLLSRLLKIKPAIPVLFIVLNPLFYHFLVRIPALLSGELYWDPSRELINNEKSRKIIAVLLGIAFISYTPECLPFITLALIVGFGIDLIHGVVCGIEAIHAKYKQSTASTPSRGHSFQSAPQPAQTIASAPNNWLARIRRQLWSSTPPHADQDSVPSSAPRPQ